MLNLSYAKIVQVSAMKACFQIAERSLSYAKIGKKAEISIRDSAFLYSFM